MNAYGVLERKAVGLAFILGPLLMTIGAASYVFGIGHTPFGTDSWVDGMLAAYGFLLMIPVYFELARILGQRAPIFGIICAAVGLCWGMTVIPAAAKLMQMDIIKAGLNDSIWNVIGSSSGWTPIFIGLVLGQLTSLLVGIGLLWKGGIPRWSAMLLIVASVFFTTGTAAGAEATWWQTSLFEPLGCLTWLVALAPIGLRYLTGPADLMVGRAHWSTPTTFPHTPQSQ